MSAHLRVIDECFSLCCCCVVSLPAFISFPFEPPNVPCDTFLRGASLHNPYGTFFPNAKEKGAFSPLFVTYHSDIKILASCFFLAGDSVTGYCSEMPSVTSQRASDLTEDMLLLSFSGQIFLHLLEVSKEKYLMR